MSELDDIRARGEAATPCRTECGSYVCETEKDRARLLAALDAVEALADDLARSAYEMCIAGGESDREADFSEGHYVGTMKEKDESAARIRAAIKTALGEL
jgi:hypothetical protein